MDSKISSVFSKVVKAGKKRTYFFDVRNTKGNDYFLTITESRKRINGDGYEKNKIFLYKEDFNKFVEAMNETVEHIKKELLPDFDFDSFSKRDGDEEFGYTPNAERTEQRAEPSSYDASALNEDSERLHQKPKPADDDNTSSSHLFPEDAEKW